MKRIVELVLAVVIVIMLLIAASLGYSIYTGWREASNPPVMDTNRPAEAYPY